jgi:methionine-rich copper-binding protein CopC
MNRQFPEERGAGSNGGNGASAQAAPTESHVGRSETPYEDPKLMEAWYLLLQCRQRGLLDSACKVLNALSAGDTNSSFAETMIGHQSPVESDAMDTALPIVFSLHFRGLLEQALPALKSCDKSLSLQEDRRKEANNQKRTLCDLIISEVFPAARTITGSCEPATSDGAFTSSKPENTPRIPIRMELYSGMLKHLNVIAPFEGALPGSSPLSVNVSGNVVNGPATSQRDPELKEVVFYLQTSNGKKLDFYIFFDSQWRPQFGKHQILKFD